MKETVIEKENQAGHSPILKIASIWKNSLWHQSLQTVAQILFLEISRVSNQKCFNIHISKFALLLRISYNTNLFVGERNPLSKQAFSHFSKLDQFSPGVVTSQVESQNRTLEPVSKKDLEELVLWLWSSSYSSWPLSQLSANSTPETSGHTSTGTPKVCWDHHMNRGHQHRQQISYTS